MKRLREMPASSPLIDQVQRLIDAAPPIPDSIAKLQRIRRSLDQPRPAGASLLRRVPSLALAGGLLLFGASAFAAVRTWVENLVARPEPAKIVQGERDRSDADLQLSAAGEPVRVHAQPASAARAADSKLSAADEPQRIRRASPDLSADERARTRGQSGHAQKQKPGRSSRRPKPTRAARALASNTSNTTGSPIAAVAASRPMAAAPKSAETLAQADATSTAAEAGSRVPALPPAADTAAETADELPAIPEPARMSPAAKRSSDSELVVRAVQTLRRDHDPALASRLLERYRSRNPAGVLAEEVLSLQIEAAVSAGDPRATSFAREYLARYPAGRYRERAERALGGGAP